MDAYRIRLENGLPIRSNDIAIRGLTRPDMELLSNWPAYPWPYDMFRFSFSGLGAEELDRAYETRARGYDRMTLVVDTGKDAAIGYVALTEIDWAGCISRNMSFRVHPLFCNQGLGFRIMSVVRDWWFGHGMNALRLDVAATNHRAVRCYMKAGFQKTGEFWREAPDLANKDLSQEKYRFLGNHVDRESKIPRVRFYWMEIQNDQPSASARGTVTP